MKKIFVVDDEKNIRDLIKKYLDKEGYETILFNNGENVLVETDRLNPDLIVLDINMPGINGLDLCKEIRKKTEIPIIFVSAKDEEFDKILGLELGADDYLSKPFSPRELVVRIKTIFRRLDKITNKKEEKIEVKDLIIFSERRYIECKGVELKLTSKEFELVHFLAKNKNISFTRESLIEKIWGYDYIGDIRMIDDLIKRIRKKLKDINSSSEISTVWGYGYRMGD